MSLSRKALLCIDDESENLKLYSEVFKEFGFFSLTASNGRVGLELARNIRVDAVILDNEMSDMTGMEVAISLKEILPGVPIIMASCNPGIREKALPLVDAFHQKEHGIVRLVQTVRALVGD